MLCKVKGECFMKKVFNVVFLYALAVVASGDLVAADTSRGMHANTNRAMISVSGATSRMPTMPVMPFNVIGNKTTSVSGGGNGGNNGGGDPDEPDPEPDPEPTPVKCPDGGVKNSTYTVENCMDDIYSCVQSGGLAGGINSMYDTNMFNSIVNGMGLCRAQVERCVSDVRINCKNVYRDMANVWLDFNERRVQPSYYNFVLRKTGLTPNQAENVCALLDVNTYGRSFDAVSVQDGTTYEYNNNVNAYNNTNGTSKNAPLGATPNYGKENTVDGQRGYYARWDAINGECLVRVAGYNKDKLITNSWLFGAVGDDKPAEVWQRAGSTFTCGKELFDFSLMNDTKTAAVVAPTGGAALGAVTGAIAGKKAKSFNCASFGDDLITRIRENAGETTIKQYISSYDGSASCEDVVDLYEKYSAMVTQKKLCEGYNFGEVVDVDITCPSSNTSLKIEKVNGVAENVVSSLVEGDCVNSCKDTCDEQKCKNCLSEKLSTYRSDLANKCYFKNLETNPKDIYCNTSEAGSECLGATEPDINRELNELKKVFGDANSEKTPAYLIEHGQEGTKGKGALIGAVSGAAAGGAAVGIVALIENKNINCKVGDGLESVAYGKTYTIDTLKNFYVKWKLNIPDTVTPTAVVRDCQEWINACAQFKTEDTCSAAQLNYQRSDMSTTVLVSGACKMSGSKCIENRSVAESHGACPVILHPTHPDIPVAPADGPND